LSPDFLSRAIERHPGLVTMLEFARLPGQDERACRAFPGARFIWEILAGFREFG
jgi:hypothetical protein